MNINEQDLFNFVNYPYKLDGKKRKYIKDNSELYNDALEFIRSAPKFANSLLSGELQFKMHLKMIEKEPKKTIILSDITSSLVKQNHIRTLAADSLSKDNSSNSKTFTDETGSYLIKVVSINDKVNIYTFTSSNEELNNFSLFIKPTGGIHYLKSNKLPLILNHSLPIENIQIVLF